MEGRQQAGQQTPAFCLVSCRGDGRGLLSMNSICEVVNAGAVTTMRQFLSCPGPKERFRSPGTESFRVRLMARYGFASRIYIGRYPWRPVSFRRSVQVGCRYQTVLHCGESRQSSCNEVLSIELLAGGLGTQRASHVPTLNCACPYLYKARRNT